MDQAQVDPQRGQRRLAAILAADVAGYTRLVEQDTEGTVTAWRAARDAVIEPTIAQRSGRLVKLTGDGFLAEFPSVEDAVLCAIEMQGSLSDSALEFRMGIHLGDVMDDGKDIHGEGVNIAARIEALAEPRSVCVSGGVLDQIRNRVALAFEDMGEHQVKHVSAPVHVYRLAPELDRYSSPTEPESQLVLPEKPSIAVLPFDNMSSDPDQEYFADGITEDIITALSKFRWFFVTARNSTFTYKGTAVDIKQVGRELGVRYVLEGSVRKAGGRVRITSQLVEAESGNHIWAERYDRELDDIFNLQDEMTLTIASAVEPELASFERERARRKPTNNLDAWDLYQRGVTELHRFTREGLDSAKKFFSEASSKDPNFSQPRAHFGYCSLVLFTFGWTDDEESLLRDGMAAAREAVEIDNRDYLGHFALGRLLAVHHSYDEAIRELETSIRFNPSFALGYYGLGVANLGVARPQVALENFDSAIRLSPNDPLMWTFLAMKGECLWALGQRERAIEVVEQAVQAPNVQYVAPLVLASYCARNGHAERAEAALQRARMMEPTLTIADGRRLISIMNPRGSNEFIEGLRLAGLEA